MEMNAKRVRLEFAIFLSMKFKPVNYEVSIY